MSRSNPSRRSWLVSKILGPMTSLRQSWTQDRAGSRWHPKKALTLENLEERTLLAVDVAVGLGGNEPHLAVNPLNPANVVISQGNDLRISNDAGLTFPILVDGPFFPAGQAGYGGCGDDVVSFDASGRLFWLYLTCIDGDGNGFDNLATDDISIAVQRVNSTTGALIGAAVDVTPGNHFDDKAWLAADATPTSPFANNLYVHWTRFDTNPTQEFFSRSTNNGAAFSAPSSVASGGGEGFRHQAHVAVAPDGDVFLSYHTDVCGGAGGGTVQVLRDNNGGAELAAGGNPPAGVEKTAAFTAGQSTVTCNRQPSGDALAYADFLMQGAAVAYIVPDTVVPNRIFVIGNDDPNNSYNNGDDGNAVLSTSFDDGATWSFVNTISHGIGNSLEVFPQGAMDRFGNFAGFWYTNQEGSTNAGADGIPGNGDDKSNLDVYASASTSGPFGFFSPDLKINDNNNRFNPDAGAPNFQGDNPPTRRIGEYNGIAVANAIAYVTWTGNTWSGGATGVGVPNGQQIYFDSFIIPNAILPPGIFLETAGVLDVCGDNDFTNEDDTFRLVRDPLFPATLDVFINNPGPVPNFVVPIALLQQINVFGIGGNDNLIVDSTSGLINVPNGIRYDGDGACPIELAGGEGFPAAGFGYDRGIDRLTLQQNAGPNNPPIVSDTLEVGALPGSGVSRIVGGPGAGNQTVFFEELEPIFDNVPAPSLIINGGTVGTIMNEDNAINYSVSDVFGPTWGKVTIDDFEPIHFTNKATLTIDAENGSDEINLNNPNTPTGLTGDCDAAVAGTQPICIIGDNPTASDKLIVNSGADNLILEPTGLGAGVVRYFVASQPAIRFTTIESLVLVDQSTQPFGIDGTTGNDLFEYIPGATPDTGTVVGTMDQNNAAGGPFALVPTTFVNMNQAAVVVFNTFGQQGGTDTFVFNGTAANDIVSFTNGGIFGGNTLRDTVAGQVFANLNLVNMASAVVRGHNGDDTFNHSGAVNITVAYEGGDPSASDVLFITGRPTTAEVVIIRPDPLNPTQQDVLGLAAPVDVSGVELIRYTGLRSAAGAPDDTLIVDLDSGDHFARIDAVDRLGQLVVPGDANGPFTDRVLSDLLPEIRYDELNTFRVGTDNDDSGNTVVTFVTRNLNGALPPNYQADLGGFDTLVIEGADGSPDRYTVTHPAAGSVAVTDNSAGSTGVTVTDVNINVGAGTGLLGRLHINTLGGDDVVLVDVNGPASNVIAVPITFDGGLNFDRLIVSGTPPTAVNTVRYTPTGPSDGRLLYTSAAGATLMTIDFLELEPVLDLVPAAALIVDGSSEDDQFNYTVGSVVANGLVTRSDAESIEFSNKATLVLNGFAGDDSFNLNNPNTPTGLTGDCDAVTAGTQSICVNGGDPTASDLLVVNGTTAANTITFTPSAPDAGTVAVVGLPTVSFTTTELLIINGLGGNDTLNVATPAATTSTVTLTPGATVDSGSVQVDSLVPMSFTNLGATGRLTVTDPTAGDADRLVYNGTAASDTFTLPHPVVPAPSILLNSQIGVGTAAVENYTLRGLGGDDTFNITPPAGVAVLVQGDEPGGSDVLNFNSVGATTVNFGASTIEDAAVAPTPNVTYSGIERINVDANSNTLAIVATTVDDDIAVTVYSASSGKVEQGPAIQKLGEVQPDIIDPVLYYTEITGALSVDLAAGEDTLIVIGNAFSQTFQVNASAAPVVAAPFGPIAANTIQVDDLNNGSIDGTVAYTNNESVQVYGLEGNDTFNVVAGTVPVFVDGGDPIGTLPGDTINVLGAIGFFAGPESDEGGFLTSGESISFDHIERIGFVQQPPPGAGGPCPFLIVGTNADDDITVIARDASYNPLADGVRDFTFSVNAGGDILVLDQPDLFIDALSGDDDIVIRTRAPNHANWNVNVRIVGGPPSAVTGDQGDVVEVETPYGPLVGVDDAIWTPFSSETGTLLLDENHDDIFNNSDTLIQLLDSFLFDCPVGPPVEYTSSPGGTEQLIYDGETGNDAFAVFATAGVDTILHVPGRGTDEGFFRVNDLLGITYQNLGPAGVIQVNGQGAADTLVAEGTLGSDTFTVAAVTSAITVNTHLPLTHINVEALRLDGLEGDDLFTINAPYAPAITTVAVNGGGPGNSDVLAINGAAGVAETFTVTLAATPGNGNVAVNAVNNPYTGIEHVVLDANSPPDNDDLVMNDDGADNLWVVNAGPASADRIQIAGRESVDYTDFNDVTLNNTNGTDLFQVYPTNLDEFTGAFTVNGDAALPIDDVLEIIGTPGIDIVTSTATAVITNGVAITAGVNLIELRVKTLENADNINLDLALPGVGKYVDAGAGNDIVDMLGTTDATILGGQGDDLIIGTPLADFIFAGSGNDTILGAGGNDQEYGEDGNDRFGDLASGNGLPDDPGNDFFFGGDGSDTVVWDPGDGDDFNDGGTGADVQIFNGSGINGSAPNAAPEIINVFADLDITTGVSTPARARITRNLGSIDVILSEVEEVDVNNGSAAAGVVDTVVVGRANDGDLGATPAPTSPYTDPTATLMDLSTTHVKVVNVNIGGTGAPDGLEDRVFVDGRPLDDNILVSLESTATGVVRVAGLPYDVRVRNASTTDLDRLTVRGNEGNDTIKSVNPTGGGALSVEDVIDITEAGGAGNDYLSADAILIGGIGKDFLEGGAGPDLFFGNQGEDTMIGGAGADTFDGGPDFDTILIRGTSGDDTINVFQSSATTLDYTIQDQAGVVTTETDTLVLDILGNRTVEAARIEAGLGADVIRANWLDSLGVDANINSLRFDVIGGPDNARDRLAVVDDTVDDTVVFRKGTTDDSGTVTIGPGNAEPLDLTFETTEFYQFVDNAGTVLGSPGQGSRIVVFKHDPYEFNDDRFIATDLGAPITLEVDPTIDPAFLSKGPPFNFNLPGDQDWYRVEAKASGTLDFQVFFEEIATLTSGRPGLPNNGNLDLEVYDRDGTFIAGHAPASANFGVNDGGAVEFNLDGDPFFEDERVRIPVVQGQVYYLRVYGQVAGNGTSSTSINNYTMTIINEPAPVPYDIELDDFPVVLPPSPGDACGSPPGAAIIPPGNAPSNNSDTGRSQFDNVTCDATPTIRFRLDDAGFLHDLPANPDDDSPPDQITRIPFNTDQNVTTTTAGYRVAVFDEGAPQQPGQLPQRLLGFARQIFEGVYEFNFATDAVNQATGLVGTPFILTDGSHFLSARVQMVDPATPTQTGFGARSVSLEIVVDTIDPPVAFGDLNVPDDGLAGESDTGVIGQPVLFTDEITSDTTPTFFGTAEANTVIRVWLDRDGDGVVDLPDDDNVLEPGEDVQLGETVAVPFDGTNQFPNGYWKITSAVDLNDPILQLGEDGVRQLLVTAEDLAGNISNISTQARLEIFLDTRGPQVTNVRSINIGGGLYDILNPKPVEDQGPTPLTAKIRIDVRDLPARAFQNPAIPGGNGPFGFQHEALNRILAEELGNYRLVGDQNGFIEIVDAKFTSTDTDPASPFAKGFVTLTFGTPLPDDRYTLTMFDRIKDDAGNALDGESNVIAATDEPDFPTGDEDPGQSFEVRFTVDSRPEIGTFCCGSWYIDLNGNGSFDDPNNHDTDAINGDIVYKFGLPGDFPVVGDWDGNGFDEIGVYGRRIDGFRFELDLNGNGAFDSKDASFLFGNGGRPVAGDWDGKGEDHVAVFNGTTWFKDSSGAPYTPATAAVPATIIPTAARGRPIAADFNGDGDDDVGLFQNNIFQLDYSSDDNFQVDTNITFGFNTTGQLPVAGDWDGDLDGNIGLFVQDRNGMFPREAAEWYLDLGRPYRGPLANDIAALFPPPGGVNVNTTGDPGDGLFQPPPTGGLGGFPPPQGGPAFPDLPLVFQDIFYQFGDELSEPIVGNFDPPSGVDDGSIPIVRPLVRLDDAATRTAAATPLIVWEDNGDTMDFAGIGGPRDVDVFQFTPTQSGAVVIETHKDGSTVDTNLAVYSSAGRVLARNNNFGGSTDSHVQLSVVAGQTYYIQINAVRRSTGAYDVVVDYLLTDPSTNPGGGGTGGGNTNPGGGGTGGGNTNPGGGGTGGGNTNPGGGGGTGGGGTGGGNTNPGGGPTISVGSAGTRTSGRIDRAGEVDSFVFTPTVDGQLQIRTAAITRSLDTILEVLDSSGNVIDQNDNASTATNNSRVVLNVLANETYTMRIRAKGTKGGDYAVALDYLLGGGL